MAGKDSLATALAYTVTVERGGFEVQIRDAGGRLIRRYVLPSPMPLDESGVAMYGSCQCPELRQ